MKTVREYNGGRTSDDFIKYLSDPDAPIEKPKAQAFGTYPGSDSVKILTDDNFEEVAKTANNLLVMFYAPCMSPCPQHRITNSLNI